MVFPLVKARLAYHCRLRLDHLVREGFGDLSGVHISGAMSRASLATAFKRNEGMMEGAVRYWTKHMDVFVGRKNGAGTSLRVMRTVPTLQQQYSIALA